MKVSFPYTDTFVHRHIGPREHDVNEMLQAIKCSSVEELINQTIPENIRLKKDLNLPEALSENEFLHRFRKLAKNNQIFKSYLGQGYYGTITPPVILRNVLENPGWYTAYTPYQAEIAQGRLEALINYQTMISDLTGMEIANASLLDEATAAAEAMTMMHALRKGKKKSANKFLVAKSCFAQTIDVLKTRAIPLGIELVIVEGQLEDWINDDVFGLLVQYPGEDGNIVDYSQAVDKAHEQGAMVAFATDLLSLTLLTSPGELGADIVVGSSQRFGVPLGYGGPHAGFFATKDQYKRQIPGRIIGKSKDAQGNPAYRMALQTREQHIRREKATSNICTAQVLLAVIAGCYAVYHGPEGIKAIGERVHGLTCVLENELKKLGYEQVNDHFFDTIKIKVGSKIELLKGIAENEGVNLRYFEDSKHIGISLDEVVSQKDLKRIVEIFAKAKNIDSEEIHIGDEYESRLPAQLVRSSNYLTDVVFSKYHSEHEMLRYLKRLENKDISLVHSMISLGSCTMKLNATTEMIPVTWPEFGNLHPFAPLSQARGYYELFKMLNMWLCEITGFSGISFQPNSGAQGEYAGLMVIREFHLSNHDKHRNIALIPASAHGTNPASAVMAGMKVVVVKCDENGNIDVADLKAKAEEHKENLSCLMVTYPSTHGVFEESIIEVCDIIHKNGGQVYMDGANMNAQVGLTSPANIGADVCHLNLHKTFCIPHGGGGPGVGPIGVAEHLVKFLPGHSVVEIGSDEAISAVSAAPWGSASILPISYAYCSLMGGDGLKKATEYAILNANYIKSRLEEHYSILYVGANGRCAHEMIVDFRSFKATAGIEVEDIAKRLMDYGFHAPTVSFPVAGTLMIEPTESESKEELDRFCDAMIAIKVEIEEIISGDADMENNVLQNAPHPAHLVMSDEWSFPYSREKAAYPVPELKANKMWPTVSRIDSAYGDRNLICTCTAIEEFA